MKATHKGGRVYARCPRCKSNVPVSHAAEDEAFRTYFIGFHDAGNRPCPGENAYYGAGETSFQVLVKIDEDEIDLVP